MELTPDEAARTLAKAAAYETPLRQRTEGIVLMVWGLATSALFVTYAFADSLGAGDAVFATLWLPWVALGTLVSFAVWRAAALAKPEAFLHAPSRPLLRVLLLSAAMGVAFAIVQPAGPTAPLGITGLAWVAIGGTNLFRSSQRGRLLWVLSGALMAASSVALELAGAPIELAGTVAIALPAFAAAGAGAWQSLGA